MYIACSTLCFGRMSFDQALRMMDELQFSKMDLAIHDEGPHIRPSDVTRDVHKWGAILKSTGLGIAAIHFLNQAPPLEYETNLRAVCQLGRLLTVPVVTIAAAPLGSDLDAETQRLSRLLGISEAEGIILSIETNSTTVTADPEGALELCKRLPGLAITLDPSYYVQSEHGPRNYDKLYPYVRHVRLRDTTNKDLQVQIGQGELDYAQIINNLTRQNYDWALSVDIHDVPEPGYPTEIEARKLLYLLESML